MTVTAAPPSRRLLGIPGRCSQWLLHRWRRSLQLRVATTTALVSAVVVLIIGVVLLGQISGGLLDAKRKAALAEANNGLRVATSELSVVTDASADSMHNSLRQIVTTLSAKGSNAGLFDVALLPRGKRQDVVSSGLIKPGNVSPRLERLVQQSRQAYEYASIPLRGGGTVPGLIIGEPVSSQIGNFGLYYFFPLQTEQRTLALVQRTVLVAGLVLVLLVAVIADLVTRQVVRPVREAATTAVRLSAGYLEERMPVRGTDDLARLASSFNEMAASMQQQITQLEELSRVQRRFTSDVSHELRTPLTTVRMAADIIHGARADFPPGVSRSAELLRGELDRFESLLADLLEISRHDAQAAELESERLDLRRVITRVAEGVSSLAARTGSELQINLPEDPVVAEVDSRRVERVLRNLLGNALEHGEGRPVELVLAGDDEAVAITVRDHGVGLRPEEVGLVFNRFWRADPSRARHTGGTGLGLAISLEDAHLHNGWLDVWGELDKGALFRLTVPVRAGGVIVESPLALRPPDASPELPPKAPGWPLDPEWGGEPTPDLDPVTGLPFSQLHLAERDPGPDTITVGGHHPGVAPDSSDGGKRG
ncbi:MAG TPA: MtrAB system histidine kinase MtrB [Mycobacteriales bacterium]|nr:MtrAB system histidine kinase MtrB [Mycobacteriales bacterium]